MYVCAFDRAANNTPRGTIAADLGTEELAHLEMVGAIIHQLTRCLTDEQIKKAGFEPYFVDHGNGVYPQAAAGFPWTAATIAVKGDILTDLHEDMAADGATAQEQPYTYFKKSKAAI